MLHLVITQNILKYSIKIILLNNEYINSKQSENKNIDILRDFFSLKIF